MTKHCPITGVNILRFLAIIIAGFIFTFGFNFVFHGILLEDMYKETAYLWRTPEQMKDFFFWCIGSQLAFVILLGLVFTRNFESKGIKEGLRFGVCLGALLGVLEFGLYPYMPIPFALAVLWFVGAFVKVVGLGIIFSLIYKN